MLPSPHSYDVTKSAFFASGMVLPSPHSLQVGWFYQVRILSKWDDVTKSAFFANGTEVGPTLQSCRLGHGSQVWNRAHCFTKSLSLNHVTWKSFLN
jgi:hypothetical protein